MALKLINRNQLSTMPDDNLVIKHTDPHTAKLKEATKVLYIKNFFSKADTMLKCLFNQNMQSKVSFE